MEKNRLEAFRDWVLAILITIMVLEVKVPDGSTWHDLEPVMPVFFTYVLSFVYLRIYWNKHHHLIKGLPPHQWNIMWGICTCYFGFRCCPFCDLETDWAS